MTVTETSARAVSGSAVVAVSVMICAPSGNGAFPIVAPVPRYPPVLLVQTNVAASVELPESPIGTPVPTVLPSAGMLIAALTLPKPD